ncbi:uncharacterized protein LOC122385370 [Amphibalanus amphitrite]|uniref:uncharacterized protein LOC122385370 n=1 Tax=Amphibalanus amphitrite TaxID=1232801 RepID=UPI001C9061CA|nr:uncharacterized protein LOC122385370 [Amphibalanus amphitrite]
MEARDSAVMQLTVMANGPLLGGREEQGEAEEPELQSRARRVPNTNVSFERDFKAVRGEVVQSTSNFLSERLDFEQQEVVKDMSRMIKAETAEEFIRSGKRIARDLFPGELTEFALNVTDRWRAMENARDAEKTDEGRLRALLREATGTCKRVLASFVTLTPHSMATERAVSHYNNIRSHHRLGMSNSTLNARLIIALNGVGTAHFDPRPAVTAFLEGKGRRMRAADPEVYEKREFVLKFFREAGNV